MELRITPDALQALGAEERHAVDDHIARIKRAEVAGDLAQIIGSSKELIETVAKIVLEVSGGEAPRGRSATLIAFMTAAENSMGNEPDDEEFRQYGRAARSMAAVVGSTRNSKGTGHGRARYEPTEEGLALSAVASAYVWCNWMLPSLDSHLQRDPQRLVTGLERDTFMKGSLARRLSDLRLDQQSDEDQRAVGRAVAARARSGTFNVAREGISDCTSRADLFPDAYRLGVLEGVLLDNGRFKPVSGLLSAACEMLAMSNDPLALAKRVSDIVLGTGWASGIDSDQAAQWHQLFVDAAPQGKSGSALELWGSLPARSEEPF